MAQELEVFIQHTELRAMLIHILSLCPLHTQRADLVGNTAYATKALLDDFTAEAVYHQLVRQRL